MRTVAVLPALQKEKEEKKRRKEKEEQEEGEIHWRLNMSHMEEKAGDNRLVVKTVG